MQTGRGMQSTNASIRSVFGNKTTKLNFVNWYLEETTDAVLFSVQRGLLCLTNGLWVQLFKAY